MSHYAVYQGAIGWQHPGWHGDFYPEDLPGDWQLTFYNTQFRCVYLPFESWRRASDAEVAGWLADTHAGFRFLLGTAGGLDAEDARRAARFGERGQLESGAEVVFVEGAPDLRALAARMQAAAQTGGPLYVISRDADLAQLRQISELMGVLGV